jgi:hypothetical protein
MIKMQAHANGTCWRLDFIFCRTLCTKYIQEWKTYNPVYFFLSIGTMQIWPYCTYLCVRWILNSVFLDNLYWIGKCSRKKLKVLSSQICMVPLDREIICIIGYFSLLNIFGTQSSAKNKIQPPACSVCMCSHFFSPRNRASKMQEKHLLFFRLQLLVDREFCCDGPLSKYL